MTDNPQQLAEIATRLIIGAGYSIDLKGHWERGADFGISLDSIAQMVDSRLQLRCILPLPSEDWNKGERHIEISSVHRLQDLTEEMRNTGWQVRIHLNPRMLVSSLIVDNEAVLFTEWLNDPAHTRLSEEPKDVAHYAEQFETHWIQSIEIGNLSTLYPDGLLETSEAERNHIAQVSTSTWDRLIYELSKKPELLRSLQPRQFEELIAELLTRDGLQVTLTPRTRDGGNDILAFNETPAGRHLYLVECKRYAQQNPVDVSLVRALFGVVTQKRATAGLLVTTSRFTKDALSFREAIKYQLELRDYSNLVKWIRRVVGTQTL